MITATSFHKISTMVIKMMMITMMLIFPVVQSCGPYGGVESVREIKRVFLTGGTLFQANVENVKNIFFSFRE